MSEQSSYSEMALESSTAIKEAFCAQQKLLQKLYNELEIEREASATSACEALAMILRLQGEKSTVKMESDHYKRLAEEKMYHAEESMEVFEDLIHQKNMEIANLEYQVRAYRDKLTSLGLEDIEFGSNEIKFSENFLQSNETETETSVAETSPENLVRRNSAPKLLKLAYLKRGNLERNRSVSPDSDTISKTIGENGKEIENYQNLDSERQTDGISSYWDQIRKLDKIVQEITGEQYGSLKGRSSRSSSAFSQLNESDQTQSLKKTVNNEMISDACSLGVHDVFEVPETNEKQGKVNGKLILIDEKNLEKLVIFPEEAINSYKKLKTLKHKDKQVFFPKKGNVVYCHTAIDDLEAQGSSQTVDTTEIRTEGEMQDVSSQEQVRTEEVLRLLREMNEKLDSLQLEIRSGKKEHKKMKSSPNLDLPMLQLTEAMLHFWL